ncbi:MAG: hypothetical protein ACT4P7_06430 [Gemmatimonadaceae bacterium]
MDPSEYRRWRAVTAVAPGTTTITAQVGTRNGSAIVKVDALYDLAALGIPRIVTRDYIAPGKILRVSRFRSGVGHDYADDAERCRSMKHYFQPLASVRPVRRIPRARCGVASRVRDSGASGTRARSAAAARHSRAPARFRTG